MMMKTSVSLSVFPAKPGSPVLFSGATDENLGHIRELGYDSVDLFVADPGSSESKEAAEKLRSFQLGTGVVMPAALAGMGLVLGSADPAVRREAVARTKEIVRFASELGAMVSLGLVRGDIAPGEAPNAFFDRFTDSCGQLLSVAGPLDVPLLIEPINRYEINNLHSTREALDFIHHSGLALYLMLDTFHMNIEDVSLADSFSEAAPLVRHIHFLDSNRLAPSMGHLDMAALLHLLERLGYGGYLCLEALPLPDPLTCARAGAKFFAKEAAR